MSRRYKNIINKKDALLTFQSYDFYAKEINTYQIRISFTDIRDIFFDWYHTTGSLVITTKNYNKGLGKIMDSESVALKIIEELKKYEENTNG